MLRWKVSAASQLRSFVYAEDSVFVGEDSGLVMAIRAETGDKLWEHKVDAFATVTAADGGVVFVGTGKGFALGLDVTTGQERWRAKGFGVINDVLPIGNRIYLSGGSLVALDRQSGQDCWHFNTFGGIGAVAVTEGSVFVGGNPRSNDGRLYRVNGTTGLSVWNYRFYAPYFPVVSGASVYDAGIGVVKLDATTGAKKWGYREQEEVTSDLALLGNVVYATFADGSVAAVAADSGAELWKANTSATNHLAVTADVVYLAGGDGRVRGLDTQTGAELWSAKVADSELLNPVPGPGVLFVHSQRDVYAFGS